MKCDYCGLESDTLTFMTIKGKYKDTKKCVRCMTDDAINKNPLIYQRLSEI